MIKHWFPTLILCEKLSLPFDDKFNDAIYEISKQYKKTYKMNTNWFCDTFNTMGLGLEKEKIFQDLIEETKKHASLLAEEYKINKRYKLSLSELWINVAAPGEYQEFHTHPRSHFSAVYYVKTPKNCGNIIFKPISSWVNQYEVKIFEESPTSSSICHYVPEPSMLLIFKSELTHMVTKNKSDEDRVSIAMNFNFVK